MRSRPGGIAAALIVMALALTGCSGTSAKDEGGTSHVATVEPIEGSDVARVTLSEDAARRLDITTAPIAALGGGTARTAMPYAAVLYDPNGDTWAYTNPEPLVFVRSPITVVTIEGNRAVLSDGPAAGTQVVTVGAAELLGAEYEVGEE
jgi:ABC-type oligopeptide transport system substrate-binding subunit